MHSIIAKLHGIWRRWPPGVCIAMLAVVAAIFPVFAPGTLTLAKKVSWTFTFFMLMAVEIFVIVKERTQQDRQYVLERERQNKAHLDQIKEIQQMRSVSDAHNTAMMRLLGAANDPVGGLKKRALETSESILDFFYTRMQQRPKQPELAFFIGFSRSSQDLMKSIAEDNEARFKIDAYDRETLGIYRQRFSERVTRIVTELGRNAYADGELNRILQNFANGTATHSDVPIVGERLGRLTDNMAEVRP